MKVLGVTGYVAEVQFGEPRVYTDRRVAATRPTMRFRRCGRGRDQGTKGPREYDRN